MGSSVPAYRLSNVDWKLVLVSSDVLGKSTYTEDKNIPQFNIENPDLFRQFISTYNFVSPAKNSMYSLQNGHAVYFKDVNDQNTFIARRPPAGYLQNIVEFVSANPVLIRVNDENALVPNIVVPFRIFAYDVDSSGVQGDLHWRTLFMGGEWAGQTLPQMFNRERVYYDASTIIGFPSSEKHERAAEFLSEVGGGGYPNNKLRCSIKTNYYDYNYNVAQYKEWASSLNSELLIPNINVIAKYLERKRIMNLFVEGSATSARFSQATWSESESKLFAYHFPAGHYYNELDKDQYFGTFFPQTTDNQQFKDAAMNSQQNIFFNDRYFHHLYYNGGYNKTILDVLDYRGNSINEKLSTFYNVEINFHRHGNMKIDVENAANPDRETGAAAKHVRLDNLKKGDTTANNYRTKQTIRKAITNAQFDSRFLEVLKDLDEGRFSEVNRKVLPFAYSLTRPEFKNTSGIPTRELDLSSRIEISNQAVGLKSTNFLELLVHAYNNPQDNLNTNYTYASPSANFHSSVEENSTQRDDNISRAVNNSAIASVINSTINYLKTYMRILMPGVTFHTMDDAVSDFYNDYNKYAADKAMNNLYGTNLHFNEVLAYKVEKIGGSPTGDASEQQVIQKFWVFNSFLAGQEIKILDSQVKYGQNYSYKITAYTLVLSHKYKYDDLRLTKQVGKGDYKSALDIGANKNEYCLEFYDPFNNNETAGQLYKSVNEVGQAARAGIARENALAPNSIAISRYPQLADFNLYVEPCLELIEIPMFEKTISVMDHPPNACNSEPFHFIDNSNRVGFNISQDSFIKRPYPETISPQDADIRIKFLNSKALQPYDVVNKFSESPVRYIEMYRIKRKPNSLSDFNDALVATIDLRIENETYNYSNKILSDKIKINTKYYYVFRYLNENRMPGPLSQIIECELVNDGGYTYALFDTVDTSEFSPNQNTTKNVLFKKLLQLEPNINQLYLIDDDVDYNDYATNQANRLHIGSAESRIWDKKFKIRLTSKKTGKKIDLNVSYNYLIRDLSKTLFTEIEPAVPMGAELPPTSADLDTASAPSAPFVSSITLDPADVALVASTSTFSSYSVDDTGIVNLGSDEAGY